MGQKPKSLTPEASLAHYVGAELRRWRQLRGLSQRELGARVHVHGDLIAKIEKADRKPTLDLLQRCDETLATGGTLGAAYRANSAPRTNETQPNRTGLAADPLTGILKILDGGLAHAETLPAELWQRAIRRMVRYPVSPPGILWSTTLEDLTYAERLLRERVSPRGQRLVLNAVVVLAGTAGNLLVDFARQDRAQQYFRLSRQAAQYADSPGLESWAIAMNAVGASAAGGHGYAATLLDHAAVIGTRAPARRLAWIQGARAQSHANAGRTRTALSALDAAAAALAVAGQPKAIDFFDQPRLVGLSGATHAALGDFATAEAELERALRLRPLTDVKGRALQTLDLANCQAAAGRPDEAAHALLIAVGRAKDQLVEPIRRKLQVVRARLDALGPMRLVSLDAELATFLTPSRGDHDAMENPLHEADI
jgi:transcriptional regulator with XRE-family HTH domain